MIVQVGLFIDQLLDSDDCPSWSVSYECFLLVCLFGLLDAIVKCNRSNELLSSYMIKTVTLTVITS